jgi:hypothetical protein
MKITECLGRRVLVNTTTSSNFVGEYVVKEFSPAMKYVKLVNEASFIGWYKIKDVKLVEVLN